MTNTKLLGAIFAATFVLVFSSYISSQPSFAQTDTNGGTIQCNTSPPNRGVFLTVDGMNGPNGSPCAFEIKNFSFGVENPTTIGSATGGAGAGKIKFNDFTIKRTTDSASPLFFQKCATGEHIPKVTLTMRKAGGDPSSAGTPFLTFTFGTVFTSKIDWSGPGDEGPEESITFVYGDLAVDYHPPK
jgi:type VI secretion system secreted protein Hcp